MHARMEVVVQALIADDQGRILMLQRPSGKWQFVGGRVEAGEKWEEALRREASEEAGITQFDIVSVMAIDNWTWKGVPQFGVCFYAHTFSSTIRLSDEHIDCRWLGTDDNLDKLEYFHSSLRLLLERALCGETHYQQLPSDR